MSRAQHPYKDSAGRWMTSALFIEKVEEKGRKVIEPPFSLSGREGYIDAKQTFLDLEDPTGTIWADKYLGGYEHLKRLLAAPWFQPEWDMWLEEMYTRMRAAAIKNIQDISILSESDAQRLGASKYIAERGWEKKRAVRGRPSKEEVKGELKRQVDMSSQTREEFERIGLKVVKGKG